MSAPCIGHVSPMFRARVQRQIPRDVAHETAQAPYLVDEDGEVTF